MYTVKEVTDRNEWDKLTGSVLLQNWAWGEFQHSIGKKIFRLGIYRANELIGAAQAIIIKSALRSHLYIPNGPVPVDPQQYILDAHKIEEITEALLQYCRKNIVSGNIHFIRIDPLLIDSIENSKIMHDLGLITASTFVQPEHTIVLDLRKTEDEILAQMSKTTRYDIKRGQKDGVTIVRSTEDKDFDIFWKMFNDTVQRQRFVAYSKNYYLTQFRTLQTGGNYAVYIAYDKETPIAAALIASDAKNSYYLHAGRAQTTVDAAKYAPKVLLWQAISDSKQAGKEFFNLYGIAKNDNDPNDPWYGLSSFKKGFGGDVISYVGALDFPITLNYWFIRLFEKTRRIWGYPYFLLKRFLAR
jgi:lipid II:glycine glycyltransferase (peptidoglycan interpeptide bridge formation enzyme)